MNGLKLTFSDFLVFGHPKLLHEPAYAPKVRIQGFFRAVFFDKEDPGPNLRFYLSLRRRVPSHINRVAVQRSFLNRGCHLWISLPHSFKEAPTSQCFKTNLFNIITGSGSL